MFFAVTTLVTTTSTTTTTTTEKIVQKITNLVDNNKANINKKKSNLYIHATFFSVGLILLGLFSYFFVKKYFFQSRLSLVEIENL